MGKHYNGEGSDRACCLAAMFFCAYHNREVTWLSDCCRAEKSFPKALLEVAVFNLSKLHKGMGVNTHSGASVKCLC